MASLSNIKFSSRKSPWGFLWLLLFCSTALKAQNYFNKTYFMGGYNNAIRNIMPLGNDGNSIAFAYNFDSISGNNTLKLLKLD